MTVQCMSAVSLQRQRDYDTRSIVKVELKKLASAVEFVAASIGYVSNKLCSRNVVQQGGGIIHSPEFLYFQPVPHDVDDTADAKKRKVDPNQTLVSLLKRQRTEPQEE